MEYPFKKLVLPKELQSQKNGRLPDALLTKIDIGGKMWHWAAASFNLMNAEAKKADVKLVNIGDYRPYAQIESLFRSRYKTTDNGRVPQITRKFEDKTWYLQKGFSPAAAPDPTGKFGSNHGWGLAIDIDVNNGKVSSWLCKNAPTYGFYLQGSDPKSGEFELWHWQYCVGDDLPTPVANLMKFLASR